MLKRKKEIIAKVMATTMLASTLTSTFTTNVSAAEPQTKATVSETTIAGDDRYKTAVEISKNYSSTSKHAVIVNGQKGIVDALTATPYASLKKAPILMTQSTKLNADTKKELTRRGVKTVDIVGGVNSVSESVKAEIEAMGITVNRIAGNSKYETSLEVAKRIDAISDVSKIAVANGEVLADAVSVAAPAAQNKMPIILAHPTNGLDAKTKAFIDGESISNSYVIGGTSSVSTATQNSLPGTKERLAGTGRQETNAAVVKKFYTSSSYDNIYVAKSGQVVKADEIADALAAGVLAASNQDPVILVGKTLANDQKTLLEGKKFTKITKVGGEIPTASIDAIKATQNDPEAIVSGVTLVNYKTIKITGKELNRIDKSKVSISGNTTSSYTANSAGTEATVEFANAFSNGTNTVKVTSNLGNVTSHTFTYSTGISTVEATTKEVATEGIQYLEFTVNGGQKRSIEELKALGWTVEFKSSKNIFYNEDAPASPLKTSKTGKLINKLNQIGLNKNDVFDYEVILTNGTQTIKTAEKKSVTVTDTSTDIAKIDSYDITFSTAASGTNGNTFKSNKLLVGETITISNIKGLLNDGSKSDITSGATVTSSDATVLSVVGKNITARKTGTAKITIAKGNIKAEVTIQVLDATTNAREINNIKFYINDVQKTSVNLTKTAASGSDNTIIVEARAFDQLGDPINTGMSLVSQVNTTATTPVQVASASIGSFVDGKANITITSSINAGTGVLKIQKTKADGTTVNVGTMNVVVKEATANLSYSLDIADYRGYLGSEDLTIDRYEYKNDNTLSLMVNLFDSNGISKGVVDISDTTKFVVKGYDEKIIEVSNTKFNLGEIVITPKLGQTKTGTTTLSLYSKAADGKETLLKSVNITVVDTTPIIESIQMKTLPEINKINTSDPEFKLIDLFTIDYTKIAAPAPGDSVNIQDPNQYKKVIEGVKVKGYENEEVLMSINSAGGGDAILFIDRGSKTGKFDPNEDFILATLKIELSTVTASSTVNATVKLNSNTPDGSIVIGLYDGVYASNKTPRDTIVNVKIPR